MKPQRVGRDCARADDRSLNEEGRQKPFSRLWATVGSVARSPRVSCDVECLDWRSEDIEKHSLRRILSFKKPMSSPLLQRREFLRKGFVLATALPFGLRQLNAVRALTAQAEAGNLHPLFSNKAALKGTPLAPFVTPIQIMRTARPSGVTRMPDGQGPVALYSMTMSALRTKLHRDLPPTNVWGFNGSMPGPAIHAHRGQTVLVDWANNLPRQHFLPIDHSIHGAGTDVPDVRTVVHLHGGRVPAASDGYPEDWRTPGNTSRYTYPNQQRAATLWYHDHALGITRLNNLAGLSGIYIIHDDFEQSLNLPSGAFDVPLLISDRTFDANGQLAYPISGKPGIPHIPEFFGETMLVNGRVTPYMAVEPRKYRFRILNACNARFLGLTLSTGQPFYQIGTDQGFAPAPVALSRLLLVPSERSDVIVDFARMAAKQIVMKNDAPAPYPRGGAVVPSNVMQFRVAASTTSKDRSTIPSKLLPFAPIDRSAAVKIRDLALVEHRDDFGTPIIDLLENAHWSAPITENPIVDTIEIWNLVNATDDAHPIHLHLVAFQIIERRKYHDDIFLHQGRIVYTSPPEPPAPQEVGWKDVVRTEPDKVTSVIAKFEGYTGRYVWHCHILEHEDNEMMRPFEVLPASAAQSGGPARVMSALALHGKAHR
jgi:spore coat protein A, manganese oxidase